MYGYPRQSLYPGAAPMAASTASSSNSSSAATAAAQGVPISTQIMQLDQEITSTLQEIDQNFTTCHQIVTSRILPAVNRYGVASARTWQGAKFWKQFFELSANVSLNPENEFDAGAGEYDDEEDAERAHGNASYEQSTTQDGESDAHNSFASDDITASPRSDAGSELYDQSLQRPGKAAKDARGDDSGDANTFYSTADGPRASSPPRFSNASMAAAARREADKKKSQRDGHAGGADPAESPFERLRRDLTENLGRPDDSLDESVLQAHQRQRDLADRREAGKVYYDDVTNDQTVEVDRSTLARDVDNLDISRSRHRDDADMSGTSPIAPPPRMSKPVASSSPGKTKKPATGTPRARAPLLRKVLDSEQRKRDTGSGSGSGRKPRTSLPRFEVTPRGGSSSQNPFAQPASVKMWNGIVDLRKTPLTARTTKGAGSNRTRADDASGGDRGKGDKSDKTASEWDSGEENDSFGWPAGMSPPVTMQFSVPQSKYAKTPAKEAARLMVEDLLKSVGASRSVGQANPRATSALPREDDADTPSQKGSELRKGVLIPGSVSSQSSRAGGRAAAVTAAASAPMVGGAVGTPLRRSKKEAKAVDRAAAAAGLHRRRDSMPTPPTVTKKGPSLSAAPAGVKQPRMSTTPEVTPQAGSFVSQSGSLLRRGPGAVDGSGGASSAAAMLIDQDEGLTTHRPPMDGSSSDDDDEVPQHLGTKLSSVALQSAAAGSSAAPGGASGAAIHSLPEEEDDSFEDDSDSLDSDDDEDDDDLQPPPSSVASSRYSVSSQAASAAGAGSGGRRDHTGASVTATGTGWTSSTVSSNSRSTGGGGGRGGRSIEDDTLFGVPKPQSQLRDDVGAGMGALRNPFNNLGSNMAGTRGAHAETNDDAAASNVVPGAKDFVVWGQVDEMGTVHGGRPLIDRDDTYSAPSPTPMHFGQPARR